MKLLAFSLFVFLSATSFGHAADQKGATKFPTDVIKFKERRDACDHFRGEEAYDRERGKFLAANMKEYCTGTDKELALLKVKYQNNVAVLKVLLDYETEIEARP